MAKNNNIQSKKMSILPLGDRVLVRPFTKEELTNKSSFGIILPENDKKEKAEQGIVIAVSEGKKVDGKIVPLSVKVGDKVAFSKYGYEDINMDGEEFYLIKEDNLLAIIK
jgi:chaperonin GroES